MELVVEVSEKDYLNFMLQYDNGVLEETVPSHRAKIAIAEGTPFLKCKDCCMWTKQSDSLQGYCAMGKGYPTGEWYCGNARKENADGTD